MNVRRIVLAIGLCMLIFQGTAYGVIGVDDNVPAQELIFPFICEEQPGTLNTLWAFAETKGLDTEVHVVVRDNKGRIVIDYDNLLTPRDVVAGDCQSLTSSMSPDQKMQLKNTIAGKDYFEGYVTVTNISAAEDSLIGWVYLFDAKLLYASANFKPYQAEGGADPTTFAEGMGAGPILADQYYLRYFLLNDNIVFPETYNWWIVLRGASTCAPSSPSCSSVTILQCIICNEDEQCVSHNIPAPDRLNIINVAPMLPNIFSGYPKAGFASCALVESGSNQGQPFTKRDFAAFTWSYEREQIISESPCANHTITDNALWQVIDPADRLRR